MRLPRVLIRGLGAALFLTVVALATGYITMWLATETNKIQLPRVIGMDATAALELLREQGFQPKVSGKEYSEEVPKDAVVSQRPASGSWLQRNSDVRLVVSRGSDAVALPNLAGLPLPEAQRLLQQQGLIIGRVARVHSPNHQKGAVIAQDPEAGTMTRRGNPVAVLLSLGQLDEPPATLTPPGQDFRRLFGGEGAPMRAP